jgi:hypothetical protein|eukprot:COSAG01_NODE_361_length_18141_cov_34.624619_2_plen_103_part_00
MAQHDRAGAGTGVGRGHSAASVHLRLPDRRAREAVRRTGGGIPSHLNEASCSAFGSESQRCGCTRRLNHQNHTGNCRRNAADWARRRATGRHGRQCRQCATQ